MSNRPQTVAHQCTYTRNELTAPLADIRHDAAATIGRLSFGEDESGDPLTAPAAEQRRRDMPADLVMLVHEHGSPVLAERLKASAKKRDGAKLSLRRSTSTGKCKTLGNS
ncbi:hypothetical protein [Burkholderia diffusa]|uniref:hypothetical protein n=1 Tax=Burkholderia diffusa TaxID=488732 RepID=UPI00157B211E|nr:hypothetical protein [Burkholderia diffusa]NTY41148.1 hypothetical protein [Burkholderia diffusa]